MESDHERYLQRAADARAERRRLRAETEQALLELRRAVFWSKLVCSESEQLRHLTERGRPQIAGPTRTGDPKVGPVLPR